MTLSHWKREVVIKSIYGSKSVEEKETKQTKRALFIHKQNVVGHMRLRSFRKPKKMLYRINKNTQEIRMVFGKSTCIKPQV